MSGWREWRGNREFRSERLAQVRFRNGIESKAILPANQWRGRWGAPFPTDYDFDIIAVRDVGEGI